MYYVLFLFFISPVLTVDISGWDLAFIAHSGNGQSVFGRWKRKMKMPCNLKSGCIPLGHHPYMYGHTRKHLKSPLVDAWNHIKVQQVMVEFLHKGRSSAFAIFDARGSNQFNWFTPARLRQSSFGDLFSDGCFDIFRLRGEGKKRFMILQDHGKCNQDRGWMTILDGKSGFCKWQRFYGYPQFLYAPHHHKTFFEKKEFRVADCMAIYLKLENEKPVPEPHAEPS